MTEISKVADLGCGLMGHGITQIAAQAGYHVVVGFYDYSSEAPVENAGLAAG
jgi:3-hydroxyacyl-CoA dehydrogenase